VTSADREPAGVHRLAIPTPFAVGRVNLYLIEDDPLTLVDSGPNSGKALDAVERALREHGYRVEDIGLLVITHQHMDHLGLTDILARRSGAEVAALDALAPWAARYSERMEADDAFAHALMRRHGIPDDVAQVLRAVSGAFRGWGARTTITRPLPDGGALRLANRTFEVLHRPGHSPSDTVFLDRERTMLIGGDHLLGHISSNPLIALPLDAPTDPSEAERQPRPPALPNYLASMRATRELPVDLVLPGHGDPVSDHVSLIDQRVRMHERRAERIFDLLSEHPRSAHEIAQELWGNVAVTQAYLTLSEVLGHVDLLVADGRISEQEVDGVVQLVATS
jgi:glyoxylase-like metal-dependent hydrolase (beta-lactamase superfamily II)